MYCIMVLHILYKLIKKEFSFILLLVLLLVLIKADLLMYQFLLSLFSPCFKICTYHTHVPASNLFCVLSVFSLSLRVSLCAASGCMHIVF